MNLDEALSLEKGARVRIRLTPQNSAVEEEREVEAAVRSTLGIEYGEVYCETQIDSPGDILQPFPHRETWVGYIQLNDLIGKVVLDEDNDDT